MSEMQCFGSYDEGRLSWEKKGPYLRMEFFQGFLLNEFPYDGKYVLFIALKGDRIEDYYEMLVGRLTDYFNDPTRSSELLYSLRCDVESLQEGLLPENWPELDRLVADLQVLTQASELKQTFLDEV